MCTADYTVSSFEARRDVTSGRLRISGELPQKIHVVYGISEKHACFMVALSEVCNLPEVRSCLILKLDRL